MCKNRNYFDSSKEFTIVITIPVQARIEDFSKCTPHYITLPGWKEDISHVHSFDELPENCKNYVLKIEELLETEVVMFSVGPDKY